MNKKHYILYLNILFLFSCSDEGINPIYGCMDENAANYCYQCTIDDGSCEVFTYNENIYEIFSQNECLDCHNQESYTGLDLSNYNEMMAGGNNGPIISDMSPATSLLITTFNDDGVMCTTIGICELPEQLIIESWISEGAPE